MSILSTRLQLTVLAPRGAAFPKASGNGARVITPRYPGKIGVLLESLLMTFLSKAERFDVVLTDPSVLGLGGAIVKWISGCKWVVDVWDIPIRCHSTVWRARAQAQLIRRLLRRAYRNADRFIVSIVPDQQLNWFKIPRVKLAIFSNAIWRDQLSPEPKKIADPFVSHQILCSRSSYTKEMGLDTLAAAFLKVRQRFPDARLTIVGQIPEKVKIQLVALRNIPEVEILDLMQHSELIARIAAAGVCVVPFKDVPDLSQTYPIKVLEYLSLGKPVVASNIHGMAQLITHGQNGLLFHPGDAEDLARNLADLFAAPALSKRLAENARDLEPKYDAKIKGDEIVSLLQDLAAN